MNEQKTISKWLSVAGIKSPSEPTFPEGKNLQLALGLILEELIEAAESSSYEECEKFLETVKNVANESLVKLKTSEKKEVGDLNELRDACADMRVVMGNLIHFSGINSQFDEDFSEVMKSNFSKFCTTVEEADESVKAYGSGTHPNKMGDKIECYHEEVQGFWIVKRKSDSKILKSVKFQEPEFKQVINK